MLLEYKVDENDYFNLQLYYISNADDFKKRRRRERLRLSGLMLVFGIISLLDEHLHHYTFFFVPSAIIFFLIYPWWSSWYYKRALRKQISPDTKKHFPYSVKLYLSDDVIDYESSIGKDLYQLHEIDKTIETRDYFYIVMPETFWIIIPKRSISDTIAVSNILKEYEKSHSVPFFNNEDWKWK